MLYLNLKILKLSNTYIPLGSVRDLYCMYIQTMYLYINIL